jgi:group II intron reverse transcriptase/maturase
MGSCWKGSALTRIKAHSLTGRINLLSLGEAFCCVKRNRGAAGIDRVSIDLYGGQLLQNLTALQRRLKDGTYQSLPLRRVHIPKGNTGETRPLGIPAVADRVAQEMVRRLLNPLFEGIFHDDSYGFRPFRGCHMAVRRVLELKRQGYQHVLDADIKGFFNNIPHHVIMNGVSALVADGNILYLVERFLKAGVMEDGVFTSTDRGTPQGGVISPLLANITLNSLDWALHDAGFRFIRYADDFVVLTKSAAKVREALDLVQQQLTSIGLALSAEKTKVTTFRQGFAFLGFDIAAWSVKMRPKSVEKFKDKIRELTPRHHNLDARVIMKVNQVVRGTANYFDTAFSHCRDLFRTLDRWMRMRIRCMKFKRKRVTDNWRLRLKHLRRQGLLFLGNVRAPPGEGTDGLPHPGATAMASPGA